MRRELLVLASKSMAVVMCLSLTGCSPPPSVVVNDMNIDVHDSISFNDARCVQSSGLIPAGQRLLVDCKLSSIKSFNYAITSGAVCNVTDAEIKRKIYIVKDGNVYGDRHEEVRISSLRCT